jgi:nanoRNase/pAp phosphatase (c-di-AMP/oligoRNAs hydrolase)
LNGREIVRDALNKFDRVFTSDDNVLIIIRPDPDSIASAMAVKFLLRRKVRSTTIAKLGRISRLDNKAMLRILKIRMKNLERLDLSHYSRFVMVDGQPSHFAADITLPQMDVVIDHHPVGNGLDDVTFRDIRPQYGSNSSILSEYMEERGWKVPPLLATALCYGIKSDTMNFERGVHQKDALAFSRLFPRARYELLQRIERWEFHRSSIPHIRKAFNHMHMSRSTLFAYLGRVDNSDIIVTAADFLTRVGGISLCVAAGTCDGVLSVVFRSDGFQRSAGKVAFQAFDKFGSAGGHKTAARAEIPLENLEKILPSCKEKSIEEFIITRIRLRNCATAKLEKNEKNTSDKKRKTKSPSEDQSNEKIPSEIKDVTGEVKSLEKSSNESI